MSVKEEVKEEVKAINENTKYGWKMKDFNYVGREDRSVLIIYIDGVKTKISPKVVYTEGTPEYKYLDNNREYRNKYFYSFRVSGSTMVKSK